ncbi:MAG: hypothetical protein QW457_07560 [Candidatus Bathyarchaeia archaeon]
MGHLYYSFDQVPALMLRLRGDRNPAIEEDVLCKSYLVTGVMKVKRER